MPKRTKNEVSAESTMNDISNLLEETPDISFDTRHDGQIVATMEAKERGTLTDPLTHRYVTQQSSEDFGRIAVVAGSITPPEPTGEGTYKNRMRLKPTR